MIRLIMIFFFVYSGSILAGPVEHKLLCKVSDQDSDSQVGLILSFEGGAFSLENPDRGCRSDYVYRESPDESSASVIFSYPTRDDMGLNAQIMIFLLQLKRSS